MNNGDRIIENIGEGYRLLFENAKQGSILTIKEIFELISGNSGLKTEVTVEKLKDTVYRTNELVACINNNNTPTLLLSSTHNNLIFQNIESILDETYKPRRDSPEFKSIEQSVATSSVLEINMDNLMNPQMTSHQYRTRPYLSVKLKNPKTEKSIDTKDYYLSQLNEDQIKLLKGLFGKEFNQVLDKIHPLSRNREFKIYFPSPDSVRNLKENDVMTDLPIFHGSNLDYAIQLCSEKINYEKGHFLAIPRNIPRLYKGVPKNARKGIDGIKGLEQSLPISVVGELLGISYNILERHAKYYANKIIKSIKGYTN